MGEPEIVRDPMQLRKLDEDYRKTEALLKTLYEDWDAAAHNTNASN
jgi:hypothetical protein